MVQPRILLVDDNLADVEAMEQAFIEYWPEAVLVVIYEGARAKEVFSASRTAVGADLILLDLHLSSVHGRDLLSALKRNPALQKLPVVVLTSTDDPAERDSCLAAGADRFMTKPRTFRALAPLLDDLRSLIACAATRGVDGDKRAVG